MMVVDMAMVVCHDCGGDDWWSCHNDNGYDYGVVVIVVIVQLSQ